MRYAELSCLVLAFMVAACGDDDKVAGPQALNENGFPLSVGNSWRYAAWSEQSDTSGTTESKSIVTWTVEDLDVVFDEPAYRLRVSFQWTTGSREGESTTGWTWFSQRGDTLTALASEGVADFDPVSAQLLKRAGPQQEAPNEWGATTLVFPLEVGASWPFIGVVFENDRKTVAAKEKVEVPAGRFEAFRVIRSASGPTLELRTDQWFSSIGIVRMEEEITTKPGIPTERSRASMELIDYELK